uniref:A24 family peptidase n=1 Tax=Desulforadius tongensis TaxID=1216062 RepID=UPI0019583F3F|nr:A24 family peptidase [Desulforadius tongensis]
MLDYFLTAVLVICLYTDIRYKKIYNIVLLPALVLALAGNLYLGGFDGGFTSIKGFLLGMGLLFIPFILGGMGAGDVKLLGVIGAFKGPAFVWLTFLAAAITGGILALIVMVKSGQFKPRLQSVWYTILSVTGIMPRVNMLGTIHSGGTGQTFPYGIAITAGTAAAYLLG